MTLGPSDAKTTIRKHFASLTPAQFSAALAQYCPELDDQPTETPSEKRWGETMNQLVLIHPPSASLPLDAYLACALTGLSTEQRQLMFHLSDIVSLICQENNINLYEPRKKTDPVYNPDVADSEVFRTDRERVIGSDLLVYLSHYPSTGAGEELDIAYNALVPIIVVAHSENRVSRMVTGIPSLKVMIEYTEPEDLRIELRNRLVEIRPILEQRKLAFSSYESNIVGERIRILREELELSRDEVADKVPLLTVESLRHIEESVDRLSNPSLTQLRQIAAVLRTTVADLVEPDLHDRLLVALEEWVSGRQAARFSGMSVKDRNRIIRRLLLRVIDSLEDDG